MSTTPQNPDVVVVGAGPVGLVAACELARRGVTVRIIDKRAEPTDESRAIAIHSRSLDMFDRMGIVDDLVATGVKSTSMRMLAVATSCFRSHSAESTVPSLSRFSRPRPRPSAC